MIIYRATYNGYEFFDTHESGAIDGLVYKLLTIGADLKGNTVEVEKLQAEADEQYQPIVGTLSFRIKRLGTGKGKKKKGVITKHRLLSRIDFDFD